MTPGQHEKEHREDLQERAEERAEAGVLFILGGQHALDDGLVAAPIPDAEHRIAQQDRIPCKPGRIARAARAMWRKLPVPQVTLLPATPASGCGCDASVRASADQPPTFRYPTTVMTTAPTSSSTVCTLSVQTTASNPPSMV